MKAAQDGTRTDRANSLNRAKTGASLFATESNW
jgi:hypothetical protein